MTPQSQSFLNSVNRGIVEKNFPNVLAEFDDFCADFNLNAQTAFKLVCTSSTASVIYLTGASYANEPTVVRQLLTEREILRNIAAQYRLTCHREQTL